MKTEIEILRITNAISYIVCKSPLSYDYNGKRLSRHDKIYIDAVLRVMAGCSDKHKFFLDDLINRLKISDEKFELVYINVSLRMFSDRVIDWAKIITLYLFAARIAQHYHDNGMESIADSVIDMNKQFVEEYIADWIVQQGGWVGI